ncbi:XRE family transcriptional regulator [Halomonas sp. DP1Y21-3]|uniref:helix-turn-helix domain-containing protein n=1 Tax=Halomonas sp. DP1Y21-3 TaxID=2859080 RepID=UPI001C98B5AD|nr:XRE family transcriptional regulator [Halomonas sp. DP1Y21-3]MBY6109925.1 XRE family transcriptional regulator [Halomonas sp. DP1Y21-3]
MSDTVTPPPRVRERPRKAGSIGTNLKALRSDRGLTIAQMAEASGSSAASISRIENGRLSPTYDVIVKLAAALEVDVSELFYHNERSALSGWRTLTRAGQGPVVETPNYRFELLCNDMVAKDFLVFSTTVLNTSIEEFGELQRHAGHEQIVVQQGEVEVWTEHYAPTRLKVADSMSFDSQMGHAVISVGDQPARILWICTS